MSETKSMKVSLETHQALTDIGRKGESFDAILRRLLAHHAKTRPLDLGEATREIQDIEEGAEG